MSFLLKFQPRVRIDNNATPMAMYMQEPPPNLVDAAHLSSDAFFLTLHNIVRQAAALNHDIRQQGDVVYYWTPVFRGQEFDSDHMTCATLARVHAEWPFDDENEDDIEPDGEGADDVDCQM